MSHLRGRWLACNVSFLLLFFWKMKKVFQKFVCCHFKDYISTVYMWITCFPDGISGHILVFHYLNSLPTHLGRKNSVDLDRNRYAT